MIKFTIDVLKFDKKGEKSGWTYIEISATQTKKLKPNTKVSFRVKGSLDHYLIKKVALLPMGDGSFILPINAEMRKGTGKKSGDKLTVIMEVDEGEFPLSSDLLKCLKDDKDASQFFKSLALSHQRYFSNWIESAKTRQTKTKRLVMAMIAFSNKQGYPEMIRANKNNPL